MGASGAPHAEPIPKKWSITHRLLKPPWSAVRAIWCKTGPMLVGLPGQVNEGICSPIFMAVYLVDPSRAVDRTGLSWWAEPKHRRGHRCDLHVAKFHRSVA